ncbi:MAG: FKBP-type peptidyl-prolyl cis-trans isomerase [Planctomycetota bacterium]
MPLTIHSPYSGKPVKVRDQDVGRAIRDEEGRIFYVVQRTSGQGVYAAVTRKGSEKDEQRYDALLTKSATARAVGQERSRQQVLDATGKQRGRQRRRLVLVVLVLLGAIAGGAWAVWSGLIDAQSVPLLREVWPGEAQEEPTGASVRPLGLAYAPASLRFTAQPTTPGDPYAAYATTPDGFGLLTTRFTDGPTPTAGQFVRVHFATYSPNGTLLDQSRPGPPLGFVFYAGHVPLAWELALTGLRLGEARSVLAPNHLIQPNAEPPARPAPRPDPAASTPRTPPFALRYELELVDIQPGITTHTNTPGQPDTDTPPARTGDTLHLHWMAFVNDQTAPFHDTRADAQPVTLTLGVSPLIPGLELGLRSLQLGESRTITIPPYLAYGSRGVGSLIPPDATLTYRVSRVAPPAPATNHTEAE